MVYGNYRTNVSSSSQFYVTVVGVAVGWEDSTGRGSLNVLHPKHIQEDSLLLLLLVPHITRLSAG